METIIINQDSWHYRLLRFLNFEARYADNFCTYTRGVLGALIIASVMVAVVLFATVSSAHFLAWLVAWLVSGFVKPEPWIILAGAAAILGVGFLLLQSLVYLCIATKMTSKRALEALPEERRAKLSDWWNAIHDRICFIIEYR